MLELPKETVDAVLADWKTAQVNERTRAALRLIEAMTLRPGTIDAALLAEVQRAGVDDLALVGVTSVTFQFNFINRVADAFDFEIPNEAQKVRLAKLLKRAGVFLRGAPERVPFVKGEGEVLRPESLEKGRARLLSAPGVVDPSVRRAAEAFVAKEWGVARAGAALIDAVWTSYLRKLARAAYTIVDEDLDALRSNGFTDEMIYEVTMAGAAGVAMLGVEAVWRARYGSVTPP